VCYSLNPQVHAFDNSSMVETLPSQAETVVSARSFSSGRPIMVSPITLRPRFNPDESWPARQLSSGDMPPQADPRQMSLFGAGWTIGSLKYLAQSGCDSVTYYEITGWRGVMETEAGSLVPGRFHSVPSMVFPLYHVLADAGDFAGGCVIACESDEPLTVEGITLAKPGHTRILLANLSSEARAVSIPAQGLGENARVRFLDETNAEAALVTPERYRMDAGEVVRLDDGALTLTLKPFAIARIDFVSST
jgi:D-apionolactonase